MKMLPTLQQMPISSATPTPFLSHYYIKHGVAFSRNKFREECVSCSWGVIFKNNKNVSDPRIQRYVAGCPCLSQGNRNRWHQICYRLLVRGVCQQCNVLLHRKPEFRSNKSLLKLQLKWCSTENSFSTRQMFKNTQKKPPNKFNLKYIRKENLFLHRKEAGFDGLPKMKGMVECRIYLLPWLEDFSCKWCYRNQKYCHFSAFYFC